MKAIEDCLDGQVEETDYQHPEILKLFSIIKQSNISAEEEKLLINEYHLEKLNMAIAMLKENFERDLIAKITGLAQGIILELKNKL